MVSPDILDPALPIIDPHHHLYRYPGSFLPRGRYMIDDFQRDLESGHNFVASVYVECSFMYYRHGPESLRTTGEAAFVDSMARLSDTGLFGPTKICAAFVGAADLTLGAAVGEVLDALNAASGHRLRGIRGAANWDASPEVNTGTRPMASQGLYSDPNLRSAIAAMQERGLVFDAWQYFTQLPDLAKLADAFPDMTFVANHCGGVLGIGPYDRTATFGTWAANVAELAKRPNVLMKLGGLAGKRNGFGYESRTTPPGMDDLVAEWSPYFHTCIENFGPERCMFESNFPVDGLAADYGTLWNVFKKSVADFSMADKKAMFCDNAARTYRIELPDLQS